MRETDDQCRDFYRLFIDRIGNLLIDDFKKLRHKANVWDLAGIIVAGIGFAIIAIGMIVILVNHDSTGWITFSEGAIVKIASFLFFKRENQMNERAEKVRGELIEQMCIYAASLCIEGADAKTKRKFYEKLMRQWLPISTEQKSELIPSHKPETKEQETEPIEVQRSDCNKKDELSSTY